MPLAQKCGRRACSLLLCAIMAAGLQACGSTRIVGRVIEGRIGHVATVPASDERLDEEGIANIQVVIRTGDDPRGTSGAVLGRATSDATGAFRIAMPQGRLPSGRVNVVASGEGIYRASGRIFLPNPGEHLLVLVQPTRSD